MCGPKGVSRLLAAGLVIFAAHAAAAQDRAVLLHWNDFHGQVYPVTGAGGAQEGGVRALARRVDEVRANEGPGRVLLLDAGDWFQGTPEGNLPRGRMIVELFNALGVDAAALGNHEFDLGLETLRELVGAARFPVLAENLVDSNGARESFVQGYCVLDAGGIRFGIIGLLTPDTPRIVRQDVGRALRVSDPVAACRRLLSEVVAAGAECLVVLSHLGIESDRALAAELPQLHVIVGGHSHTALLQPERTASGTVLAQAGARGRYLGRLEVLRQPAGGFRVAGTLEALPAVDQGPPAIEEILARYRPTIDAQMEEVAGALAGPLEPSARSSIGSSPLGGWLARVMAEVAGVEIGLHNKGGIRAALPAGPVTARQLFEISPFGNEVVVCELLGSDLQEVLETSLADARVRLEVSGLSVTWRQEAQGARLVEVRVGDEPLQPEATYRIATNDYLARGGDGWQQFERRSPARSTGIGVFEASLAAFRAAPPVPEAFADRYFEVPVPAVEERSVLSFGERALSLFGLLAILGLAYGFSTARYAVRWRTVLWGVCLQMLFAAVLLPRNETLSLSALSVLGALIVIYLVDRMALGTGGTRWAARGCVLAGGAVVVFAAQRLEEPGVTVWLLGAAVVAWLVGLATHRARFVQACFLVVLLIGLGRLWAHGVTGQVAMQFISQKVVVFLGYTEAGARFLFANLAAGEHAFPDTNTWPGFGFQFAFRVLPTIIFFSTVMAVLYQLGVMQVVIGALARFMRWSMQTSGSETVSCSANIFVGQTEAPFLVKPFLPGMTVSELHAVMVGGFATIAGGVLAAYVGMGVDAAHLIAASVMAAPAALVLAKLLCPETGQSETSGEATDPQIPRADNLVMAATNGVTDGLKLAVNVGAMLIGFMAFIAFLDGMLGWFDATVDGAWLGGALDPLSGEHLGWVPGSLRTLLGTLFQPLAFLMGVPWEDAGKVGYLLGIKIGANEFVAYQALSEHLRVGDLAPRSVVIATYALCGFANFASVGIQIGGIGALAPQRRAELGRIGIRAMFGGALASCMTATVAGMLL